MQMRSRVRLTLLNPHVLPLFISYTEQQGEVDKISSKFILCDYIRNSNDHSVLQSIDITYKEKCKFLDAHSRLRFSQPANTAASPYAARRPLEPGYMQPVPGVRIAKCGSLRCPHDLKAWNRLKPETSETSSLYQCPPPLRRIFDRRSSLFWWREATIGITSSLAGTYGLPKQGFL